MSTDESILRQALILFAQTHERDHGCVDANRARELATLHEDAS